jgi:hypothetical protein
MLKVSLKYQKQKAITVQWLLKKQTNNEEKNFAMRAKVAWLLHIAHQPINSLG